MLLPIDGLHVEPDEDDPLGSPKNRQIQRLRTGVPIEMNNPWLERQSRGVVSLYSVEVELPRRFLVLRPEFPAKVFPDLGVVLSPPFNVAGVKIFCCWDDSECVVDCDGGDC